MAVLQSPPPALLIPAPAVPGPKPGIVVVGADGLAFHLLAWEELTCNALEPNVFYEPWMLLPAVRSFGPEADLRLVLVYLPDPAKPQAARLCGFFPVQRLRRFKRLPVPVLTSWRHLHCFLGTPLLRQGQALEALQAFLAWAARDGLGALVFSAVTGDGPFQQMLIEQVHQGRNLTFLEESSLRALAVRAENGETYLNKALSGANRSEYRRLRRRLEDQGKLESVSLAADGSVDLWVDRFLELERAGWKGKENTALGSNPVESDYFRTIARAAFERGRLMMLGLELNGKPIAMKCNFLAPPGSFAFKIAFDEAWFRSSPGVLLELDNLRLLHQTPGVEWMDSCALPDHPMINRLWPERRTVQTVVLSTGNWRGDLLVSSLPMFRWLGRLLRRPHRPA